MSEQTFCENCECVLDTEGTCWHCAFEVQSNNMEALEERYTHIVTRLEVRIGDLEGRIRELEDDKRKLEYRNIKLGRELADAQYNRKSW